MGKSTAAYITNNKHLLLLLRDNIPTIKDPNKWDTPGGSCEENESYEDCLVRELKEELEIEVALARLVFLWESVTPRGNTERSFFIRITDSEKEALRLHEGQSMRFFGLTDLEELNFTEHLMNIYAQKKHLLAKLLEDPVL